MQFINIRELSRSPSKYVKIANEIDDVVITRNGHPYAILSKLNDEDLEDFILAKHFNLESELKIAESEYKDGRTINARDLLKEINESSTA